MNTGISKGDRAVLKRLAAGERVPSSQMSDRLRKACDPGWVSLRLVDCEMQGLRRRVYCARPRRLADFSAILERTFPGYATELPIEMTRAQAAHLQGNSKLAPMKDALVVLRDVAGALSNGASGDLRAYWVSELEKMVMPSGLRVLTVENEDTFQHVAPGAAGLPDFDVAVLTHGELAARTGQWLASSPGISLVHYGDFDWAGMSIYQHIRAHFGEGSCSLHLPIGLEAAFERQRCFGKGAMDNKQARPVAQCDEVARVLALIDKYGGVGVEQQVFDLSA